MLNVAQRTARNNANEFQNDGSRNIELTALIISVNIAGYFVEKVFVIRYRERKFVNIAVRVTGMFCRPERR